MPTTVPVASWILGALAVAVLTALCLPLPRPSVALVASDVARTRPQSAVAPHLRSRSEAGSVPSDGVLRVQQPLHESTEAADAFHFGLPLAFATAVSGLILMVHRMVSRQRPRNRLAAMASLSAERTAGLTGRPAARSVRKGLRPLHSRMQDEDIADVEKHLMNYLTYKSVRVVLNQLVETDLSPMKADFMWLRKFCVENSLSDSEAFLKKLSTTRPQFADRLMVTRLDMFAQWSKWMDSGDGIQRRITDSNLRVQRHQLNQAAKLEFKGKVVRVKEAIEER